MNRIKKVPFTLQDLEPHGGEWDTNVHLPVWLTDTEKSQIQARIAIWAVDLLQVFRSLKQSPTLPK